MKYEVIVSNIGNVHSGDNLRKAKAVFREYVSQSKTGYGRAGGESVTLIKDGEILKEHTTTRYYCELTDTFGGEANYSWVNRKQIIVTDKSSPIAIVRAGKKALGLSGVRCRVSSYGDGWELRPYGQCTVAVITTVE